MAKKRVHELAKQYDIPLAEVMKRLNAYGLEVKAAASAVDEAEADRALTGKTPKKSENGAQQQPQRPRERQGALLAADPRDFPRQPKFGRGVARHSRERCQ